MIEVKCQTCGKNFNTYPSWVKQGSGKHCSRKCSDQGEKHEISCQICSNKFITYQHRIKENRGKFCSKPCFYKYKSTLPAWNKGKPSPWAIGNKYRLGKSNLVPHKMVGKDNPKWKNGITVGKENRKNYFNFKGLERFNRKRKAGGNHTLKQWIDLKNKYNLMCLWCKKFEPEIVLTQDHVIPIILGGSDDISNIQPLCKNCNSKKHTNSTDYRLI